MRRSWEAAPIERAAPAVDLLEQPGPHGLVAQLGPVYGQRRLVGERAQQVAVLLGQVHVLEDQHADGTLADHQGDRDPARSRCVLETEGPGLTTTGRQRCHVAVGQGLPGRRRHLEPVLGRGRQHQCRPGRREGSLDGGNDVRQQLGQGEIAVEGLRELEESNRLASATHSVLSCRSELGHHLGHHEDDDDVDAERDPVLRRVNGERVVRREEEDVIEHEARHRPDGTGHEAADHDADQRGQDEDERGSGRAEVRAEGQQHGEQHELPGQCRHGAENDAMVRSVRPEPAWRHFCHSFPSFGASSECTDGLSGQGKKGAR